MLKSKGFTLIELMLSISIISILLTLALPNLNSFIVSMRVNNEITSLYRLLLVTRNSAIYSGQDVTICPLDTDNKCNTNWQGNIGVFIDTNRNEAFDQGDDETLIRFKNSIKAGDQLIYGKYRNRIIYQPTGHLSMLFNGTFVYCPKNHQTLSRGIIVARSGRLHLSTDANNDGKNDRNKKELTCN